MKKVSAPDPRDVRIQTIIDEEMHKRGFNSRVQMAKFLNYPYSTFTLKYKEPKRFYVDDIRYMLDKFGIPESERGGIL